MKWNPFSGIYSNCLQILIELKLVGWKHNFVVIAVLGYLSILCTFSVVIHRVCGHGYVNYMKVTSVKHGFGCFN